MGSGRNSDNAVGWCVRPARFCQVFPAPPSCALHLFSALLAVGLENLGNVNRVFVPEPGSQTASTPRSKSHRQCETPTRIRLYTSAVPASEPEADGVAEDACAGSAPTTDHHWKARKRAASSLVLLRPRRRHSPAPGCWRDFAVTRRVTANLYSIELDFGIGSSSVPGLLCPFLSDGLSLSLLWDVSPGQEPGSQTARRQSHRQLCRPRSPRPTASPRMPARVPARSPLPTLEGKG